MEENGWDYLQVLLRGLDTVSRLDRRNLVRPHHGCIVVDLRLAMGRTPRLLIPHKRGLVAGLIQHVEVCQPWKLARCLLSLRLQEYARRMPIFRASERACAETRQSDRSQGRHEGWGQLEIHTRGLTVPVSTSALLTAEAIVTPPCSTHKIGERLRTTQSAVRSSAAITYVHGAEMRRLHVLRVFERGMQSLPWDAQRISPSGLAMLPRARARLVCYRNGGPRSIHSKCVVANIHGWRVPTRSG